MSIKSNNFNIENPFDIKGTTLVHCWDTQSSHLEIPEGVEEIARGAFGASNSYGQCDKLETITFPSTLKTIENQGFRSCSALSSLHFPEGLEKIQGAAFMGCSALKELTLPSTLHILGSKAFSSCTSLQTVVFTKAIPHLGESLFLDCQSLKTVHFLGEKIPQNTFTRCDSLKEIHLSHGLKILGLGAFSLCSALESITLPDSLEHIEQAVFRNCKALQEIHLPHGLKSLGNIAFSFCSALESITLPDSIEHIGQGAFDSCKSLKRIRLPKHLTWLGENTFKSCPSLKKITKGHSSRPCTVEKNVFPPMKQLEYLDKDALSLFPLEEQFALCLASWEGEKGNRQEKAVKQLLFTSLKLQIYTLSQDNMFLIGALLEGMDHMPLHRLQDEIEKSISRRNTEVTARLLNYQNSHYTQEEIDGFEERKDMVAMGFVLPTLGEFSREWHCKKLCKDIYITGYCGSAEEATIPKALVNGYIIKSLDNENSTSTTLKKLRIEGDLELCNLRDVSFPLESLEILGTISKYVYCYELATLKECSYQGQGHKKLSFSFTGTALESFVIPHGVTEISTNSFHNCSNLRSITIPPSVTSIGYNALPKGTNLTVYGKKDSQAERYCMRNFIPFAVIPD